MSNNQRTDGLDALAAVPSPRRTDAAFARAVQDGVARRRARSSFALPAFAAAAAAFTFLVIRPDEGHRVLAVASEPPAALMADSVDDEDVLFALPSLDGSSDEELANLDRVLDRRIAASRRSP